MQVFENFQGEFGLLGQDSHWESGSSCHKLILQWTIGTCQGNSRATHAREFWPIKIILVLRAGTGLAKFDNFISFDLNIEHTLVTNNAFDVMSSSIYLE